ncbi:MAG: hypothetical protein JST29_05505 [Bacteroidetes bacterium]|nr:hypothetical protein [Bacteroidota bacterium]
MSEEIIIIPDKKIAFTVDASEETDNNTTQTIAYFLEALSNIGSTGTGNEDAPGSIAGTPSSFVDGTQNSIAENTAIQKQPVIYTATPTPTGGTQATQPTPPTNKPKQKCKQPINWMALLIIVVLFILIIRGISK